LVRIRISGTLPLLKDPHSDPAIFVSALQDGDKIFFFLLSFFVYFFLKLHLLYIIFKEKSHKEVTEQEERRFFLLFLLDERRIWSRIREAQKNTDPDLQHWLPLVLNLAPFPNSIIHWSVSYLCGLFRVT
jgi:hypothetical protein